MKTKAQVQKKLGGRNLEVFFRAYFNNKMMIMLMMIEHPEIAKSILSCEKQKIFLHDIEHHFLMDGTKAKYRHAFRWLERFFDRYPNIDYDHVYKAIKMVNLIYEAFGFKLPPRLEERRIELERLGGNHGPSRT